MGYILPQMLALKETLLTHGIGAIALRLRSKLEILRAAYSFPEAVGWMANDQLATRLVTTICRPHMTFIDVGAHIGSIISQVRQNDSTVKLIAIEATPKKANDLRRRFPQVELFDCAVGESHGVSSFFVHEEKSGYNSLIRSDGSPNEKVTEITVPLRLLDELVSADDVDVVKIDVEGGELGVLLGSSALLDRCRPTVLFESGPSASNPSGYTKEGLFEFLAERKYCVLLPNRIAHDGPGLDLSGFLESHLYPRRTTNYFAVPTERRLEIRERARNVLGTKRV